MAGLAAVVAAAAGLGPLVRIAPWMIGALLALALAAGIGLTWKPLVAARNPVTPNFAFGPVPGAVTQSVDFPGGPLDTVTLWTRSGGAHGVGEVHVLQSADGPPLRSARVQASPGADLQATDAAFDPIDLPAGPLLLRIVVPEHSEAPLYVGATIGDAYRGGALVDASGQGTPGVDLAFAASGRAGPLNRLRAQARSGLAYLAVGLTAALVAGSAIGTAAWSALARERYGRPAAIAAGTGAFAAAALGLLHGPSVLA